MPLFLFMCGAAIPFALPKRLDAEGRPTAVFWKHVGWRFAMLWVFGMICQGHLLEFDRMTFYPYSNTLQTIAAGYVIAALALFIRNAKVRFALPFVLAAVYGGILAAHGKYLPEDNAAMKVELWILHHVLPEGSKVYGWIGGYTWWLTTFMFGQFALLAYMISGPFRSGLIGFAQVAFKGMPHLLGTARYQPMFEIVGMCILMTFALVIRRKLKAR